MGSKVDVCLEVASRRVFAAAIDWPGWCRSGRAEDDAIETLLRYGPRYEKAIHSADATFRPPADVSLFRVVERLDGNATTDFGAPGAPPAVDGRPAHQPELDWLIGLLRSCWSTFDAAARNARGVELTKGPRGGGRDLDKIVGHVADAELAYLGQLGAKQHGHGWNVADIKILREDIVQAIMASAHGALPPPSSRRRAPLWTARYFIRRTAWHALDHAWEIEDRSGR